MFVGNWFFSFKIMFTLLKKLLTQHSHDCVYQQNFESVGYQVWMNGKVPILIIMCQHIKRDQLSQKIKIDFLLFPKWLFFHLNFGAKIFEIGHCVLEIWQFHWGCHNRLVKSWFWEKCSLNSRICTQSIGIWKFRGPFVHENPVFAPNPSSNLKIEYWRFQNMWNLPIDFGIIFWDKNFDFASP